MANLEVPNWHLRPKGGAWEPRLLDKRHAPIQIRVRSKIICDSDGESSVRRARRDPVTAKENLLRRGVERSRTASQNGSQSPQMMGQF